MPKRRTNHSPNLGNPATKTRRSTLAANHARSQSATGPSRASRAAHNRSAAEIRPSRAAALKGAMARGLQNATGSAANAPKLRTRQAPPAQEGKTLRLPGGRSLTVTRRGFIAGAVGAVGVAALGAAGYGAYRARAATGPTVESLTVPEDHVVASTDFTRMDDASQGIYLAVSKELPYGTLVYASDNSVAACLLPTDEANPLCQIGLLNLSSGQCPTVVSQAVGHSDGFQIFDVRACSSGVVWTEANIMDGLWRVYAATTDGSSIGEPICLEERDSLWEMPTLAACAGYAWWQMNPDPNGTAKRERSVLMRAAFGSEAAEEAYSSSARMSTPPYATADGIVITPRVEGSSSYTQLTYLSASTAQVLDALALPSTMRPFEAGYGPTGFHFSFNAIYKVGQGIKDLGTYVPMAPTAAATMATETAAAHAARQQALAQAEEDGKEAAPETMLGINATSVVHAVDSAAATAYSEGEWFRFARTPSAPAAWCGNWFMVMASPSVCGMNFNTREYFSLDVKSGAASYGDYLASTGACERLVTFTNIDYTPIGGSREKYCLVRVWAPN